MYSNSEAEVGSPSVIRGSQYLKTNFFDFLCLTIEVTTPVAISDGSVLSTNCIPTHLNFVFAILFISVGESIRYWCRFRAFGGS